MKCNFSYSSVDMDIECEVWKMNIFCSMNTIASDIVVVWRNILVAMSSIVSNSRGVIQSHRKIGIEKNILCICAALSHREQEGKKIHASVYD